MPSTTERLLLGTATVLMGLIAGFFYAYACSVMVGLARVDDSTFITTMQWINATVRNAAFAPSFFGALAVTGVTALVAYRHRSAGRIWILAAFALYAAAFAITMGISVPLNDQLAAAGPAAGIADVAVVRAAYEDSWVAWNIARAALSAMALVALVCAIFRVTIPLTEPARTASR
jgi:uncharacterized membrane protein